MLQTPLSIHLRRTNSWKTTLTPFSHFPHHPDPDLARLLRSSAAAHPLTLSVPWVPNPQWPSPPFWSRQERACYRGSRPPSPPPREDPQPHQSLT
ncbi:unnamed protein product [Chondrus crispus]|uniref:Uncharacterized protein n=1 Tax=Chondrus crispus TaxID=2769 RepID=R7QHA9_CHOCR|nr:unnamed protein product [Chondrus crispus]CDF37907.1 unnamed protein product [Chondrus crispus]|eukprot:XP_005717778.1 unnamed protein product [Chondrus crispus]